MPFVLRTAARHRRTTWRSVDEYALTRATVNSSTKADRYGFHSGRVKTAPSDLPIVASHTSPSAEKSRALFICSREYASMPLAVASILCQNKEGEVGGVSRRRAAEEVWG